MSYINPKYKYKKRELQSWSYYLDQIKSGSTNALSELLSLAESNIPEHSDIVHKVLQQCTPNTNTKRVAFSGSPGAGKSTLLNALTDYVANNNPALKIAILAVDPSSEKSKGSILGDKTRMEQLVSKQNVFIRPIASGSEQGGVAEATYRSILICEAAGYDNVFIETVGVGQSAYEASKLSDLFILLLNPGTGDELQGIKRGIVEMADILVVNKADGKNEHAAKMTQKAYSNAIHLNSSVKSFWTPKVIRCSALENIGIDDLNDEIETYFSNGRASIIKSRIEQRSYWLYKEVNRILFQKFLEDADSKAQFDKVIIALKEGKTSLFEALQKIKQDIL